MTITFYSYKGGVGRTQLLANLAAYFCHYTHKKILIIDWDLEAPGLHYFFDKNKTQSKGLIEFLMAYNDLMENNDNITTENINNFLDKTFPNHIIPAVLKSTNKKGQVDMMTAGLYDKDYTQKITNFDWQHFYNTLDGNFFIEILKRYLKNLDYEFVFIDSRTGLNDYSGICNVQMPDANVMLIAPTEQNIIGSADVINRIVTNDYIATHKQRKPLIFPILSRLDTTKGIAASQWITRFKKQLNPTLENMIKLARYKKTVLTKQKIQEDINEYTDKTTLFYDTDIAYGERLLFTKDKQTIESLTLLGKLENVAKLLLAFQSYPLIEHNYLPFSNTKDTYKRNHSIEMERLLTIFKEATDNKINIKDTDLNDAVILFQNVKKETIELAELANSISYYYYQKNDFDAALEYAQRAQWISKNILGFEHFYSANIYTNMGFIFFQKKDLDTALEYFEKSLSIKKVFLDEENLDIAKLYYNIGFIYFNKKELDKALEFIQKEIFIIEKISGIGHIDTAISYYNIGILYISKNEPHKALEYFKKALYIREKILGIEHPDTKKTIEYIKKTENKIKNE